MIEVKVPGKLYLSGEYAVVEPGNSAILIAVNKFIFVKLKKSDDRGSIKSYSDLKLIWSRVDKDIVVEQEDDRYSYILAAINITEKFLEEKGFELDYYDIEVKSSLESEDGLKYGLGSSAAVTVAIVKALLEYYKYDYTNLEVFKLASMASLEKNPKGSCGDIAGVAFTGMIFYRSFSRKDILKKMQENTVSELVCMEWENLEIKPIRLNPFFKFLIGWTRVPASSINLVKKARNNLSQDQKFYKEFLDISNACVRGFISAYENSDFEGIRNFIDRNRKILNDFAHRYNIPLERNKLKKLCDIAVEHGASSKTSGAGGGDCGIAIMKASDRTEELLNSWKRENIACLDLEIYED
ncbi:phosphomevalonate kinase [Peptoniphilaceae bacterium SGI.131]